MKQLTEAQRQASVERKARFRELCKKVAQMTPEQKHDLASKLGVVSCEGHPLSLYNTCLIIMQGGTSTTIVGGFRQWIKQGRAVKKGEHGYAIWFPRQKKEESTPTLEEEASTQKDDLSFLMGTVFDVSQTIEIQTGQTS